MTTTQCTGNGTTLSHDMLVLLHGTCPTCQQAGTPTQTGRADATRGYCEKRGANVVYISDAPDGLTSYRFLVGSWA